MEISNSIVNYSKNSVGRPKFQSFFPVGIRVPRIFPIGMKFQGVLMTVVQFLAILLADFSSGQCSGLHRLCDTGVYAMLGLVSIFCFNSFKPCWPRFQLKFPSLPSTQKRRGTMIQNQTTLLPFSTQLNIVPDFFHQSTVRSWVQTTLEASWSFGVMMDTRWWDPIRHYV